MVWGQILASPEFLNTVATGIFGEDSRLTDLVNLAGAGYGLYDDARKNQQAEDNYEDAVASQTQMLQLLSRQYQAQTQYDAELRARILAQTGNLSSSLMNAYNDLGAQPVVTSGDVAADYGQIKASKMADFNDMVGMITSQSVANQYSRLGGADSYSADQGREAALVKQFTPQLMALDNDAMNEAIGRNSNLTGLYNTNRSNILNEIAGVYAPGISAETNMYRPEYSASASGNLIGLLGSFARDQSEAQATRATNAQGSLNNLTSAIQKILGGGQQTTNTETLSEEEKERIRNGGKTPTSVPSNAPGGGFGGGLVDNSPITWWNK